MNSGILRNDIEYVVHCESDGAVIGPLSIMHAHLKGPRSVLTHYSTWSMIYHPFTGTYGIQQKSPKIRDKLTQGKWDMGVAGHNCYVRRGNTFDFLDFEDNLAKESEEEIGIKIKMFESLGEFKIAARNLGDQSIAHIFETFHYQTSHDNEWVGLGFIITPSTEVYFKDGEVTDFRWLTPTDLGEFLKNNNNYCDPLPMVFEKAENFRKEHLSFLCNCCKTQTP